MLDVLKEAIRQALHGTGILDKDGYDCDAEELVEAIVSNFEYLMEEERR